MRSLLLNIQDTVIKYVRIISKIVKVDVEVVDDNLFRIAGTGIYANDINKDMSSKGHVYKHVLKTGERQIIFEPGKDDLCNKCPDKNNCKENFEVCTPIKYKEEILGVIGMVCSNMDMKKVLQKNLSIYLDFLEQISEFIAIKAYEVQDSKKNLSFVRTLNIVLNEINSGVIIFNKEKRIISINEYARNMFNIYEFDFSEKIINIMETGDTLNKDKEYKVDINNITFTVVGRVRIIDEDNEKWTGFLIFNSIDNIENLEQDMNAIRDIYLNDKIIGNSKSTKLLKSKINNIADSNSAVLITGESGTGKEIVATAIWKAGNRKKNRFITINCSTLSESQLEMEMFGYVGDAFEGSNLKGQIGKFELANNGIIYIDEIGEMPLYLQTKLVGIIEERKITRIGSSQQIPINVRIIASTNKDLNKMINENKFKKELYYRLCILPIKVAPLRERKEDIEDLCIYFIERYTKIFNKNFVGINQEVINFMKEYNWYGNVRELKNTVEFMVNIMDENGVITKENLPENILKGEHKEDDESGEEEIISLKELEKREILRGLKIYGNTVEGKKVIAKKLGIGIATLYRKIDKIYK